jgi:WD40 repeat protein
VNLKSATVTNFINFVPENFSLINWTVAHSKSRIALSDRFGRIVFLNLDDYKHRIADVPEKSIIWSLAFSSNANQVWTGTENGEIFQWDFSSGALVQSAKNITKLSGEIQSLAISACANWLAVGLHSDSTIWIYDIRNSNWHRQLIGHRRFVTSMTFTQDSSRLLSAGSDGRIIVWSVPEFQEISAFEIETNDSQDNDEGIATLHVSKDQHIIAALTEDGRLRTWTGKSTHSK